MATCRTSCQPGPQDWCKFRCHSMSCIWAATPEVISWNWAVTPEVISWNWAAMTEVISWNWAAMTEGTSFIQAGMREGTPWKWAGTTDGKTWSWAGVTVSHLVSWPSSLTAEPKSMIVTFSSSLGESLVRRCKTVMPVTWSPGCFHP